MCNPELFHFPLWFRFKGAPLDRPGGAWWCEVFWTEKQRANFIELVGPFCADYALTAADYKQKAQHANAS